MPPIQQSGAKKPPNPPAFPHVTQSKSSGSNTIYTHVSEGMTLRDWFAGMALASLLQVKDDLSPGESAYSGHPALAADDAYRFADAMLATRGES